MKTKTVLRLVSALLLLSSRIPVSIATPIEIWFEEELFLLKGKHYFLPHENENQTLPHERFRPLLVMPVNKGPDEEEALRVLGELEASGYNNLVAALKQINWVKDNQRLISFAQFLIDNELLAEFLNNAKAIAKIVAAKGTPHKIKEDKTPNALFILWIETIFPHWGSMIQNGEIEEENLRFIFNYRTHQDLLFSLAAENIQCLTLFRQNHYLFEAAQILPAMGLPAINSFSEAANLLTGMQNLHTMHSVANILLIAAGSFHEHGQVSIPPGFDNVFSALMTLLMNSPGLEDYATGIATYILHHGVNGIGSPPPAFTSDEQPLIAFLNSYWLKFESLLQYNYEDMLAVISSPDHNSEPVVPEQDQNEVEDVLPIQETHPDSD